MAALLAALWGRIGPYVLGAVALVGALLTFAASQRRAGRAEVQAETVRQTLNNMEVRHAVEDDVRRARPGAAADRLRDRWARD